MASIGDAVITTDAGGQVSLLNAVAQSLTGWSQEEAAGQPLEQVLVIRNEETGLQVENLVTKVLLEGRIVGLANHTLLIAKDGHATPIDDSAAPIRAGPKIAGVVLVFRDITGRKQAEKRSSGVSARCAWPTPPCYARTKTSTSSHLPPARFAGAAPHDHQLFATADERL